MNERTEELASLHALDLLEGEGLAAFEREMAKDPALRQLVSGLREAASCLVLTSSAPAPIPQLRDRLMASIAGRSQRQPDSVSATSSGKVVPFGNLSWLGWSIAAGFALVATWLGQRSFSTQRELVSTNTLVEIANANLQVLRNQLDAERLIALQQTNDLKKARQEVAGLSESLAKERSLSANQLADLQNKYDLANFKISRLASMLGNTPEAAAIAVWNPSTQQGVLAVQKLPALATNQDYQLWVIDPQYKDPVDSGVFTVDPATGEGRMQFSPKQPIANATNFAVSRERKGGVPKATELVLFGK